MSKPLINIQPKQAYLYACFLVLYEFVTYMANDMIMPGMLQVVHGFQGNESEVATSLSAYILGGASLQLFLGPISDAYGRRPVMLFGAIFFFLCTIFIGCSFSMNLFLLARFFQGMGLCFIGVIGYATVQEIYTEMDAVRLIGIMGSVSTIAPLIGPLIGSAILHYSSWRSIFVFIGIGALIALWGLWRYMPEPVGQMRHDGVTIEKHQFSLRLILSNYKQLLKNPALIIGSFASGLLMLPCLAWIALGPIMLIAEAKLTLTQYALWQIPVFGASILGNWILAWLTNRHSLVSVISIGSKIMTGGLILTFILPWMVNDYFVWLMPGIILYAVGIGITHAPLDRLILFSTHIAKGTTSALLSMLVMLIAVIGIEACNVLYASHHNLVFGAIYACIGVLTWVLIHICRLFYNNREPT